MPRIGVIAELGRISNLPTVVSNCLLGAVIAGLGADDALPFLAALVSSICFYFGGMAMNDLVDYPRDKSSKRDRPLVGGRISRGAALNLMIGAFLLAFVVLLPFGTGGLVAATALFAAIALYNFSHARFASSSLLMGACRGIVYMLPAAVAGNWGNIPMLLGVAGLMTCYIQCVTMVARGEDWKRGGAAALPWALVAAGIATAPGVFLGGDAGLLISVGAALLALPCLLPLLGRKPSIRVSVMGFLAMISIIDGCFAFALGGTLTAGACVLCYVATKMLHLRISGT